MRIIQKSILKDATLQAKEAKGADDGIKTALEPGGYSYPVNWRIGSYILSCLY